jgi:anti-sigma-K factor RskA
MLPECYERGDRGECWNEADARRRLVAAVYRRRTAWHAVRFGALAASIVACVAIGAWQLRMRQSRSHAMPIAFSANNHAPEPQSPWQSADALAMQSGIVARLQSENATKHAEIHKLQVLAERMDADRQAARESLAELADAKAVSEAHARSISLQRDKLSEELRDAYLASERLEQEMADLQSDHDKALTQLATVEGRLKEVTAISQDQQQRLKEAEQFLRSDRDIRDLMTARNLYIADVFDVDSNSRTRKPFGRIFYTQGKSLLFYAFDLDRQRRVKETSTFQVWGQKETAQGEAARPLDLGILYLDSDSNRRWVLRSDDAQTLSEIEAVFVTVEPSGGSRKPTGKPFLFAMLRKEANHP